MDKAMDILINGKSDTELLEALVLALTQHNHFALNEWAKYTTMSTETGANIEVVRHIARHVLARVENEITFQTLGGETIALSVNEGFSD